VWYFFFTAVLPSRFGNPILRNQAEPPFNFQLWLGHPPHDLGAIEQAIRSNSSSDPARRHQGWLGLLRDGTFSFGSLSEQEMKDLNYAPTGVGSWKFAALGATEEKDTPGKPFHYDTKFESSDWKKFHDALKNHQEMILGTILPRYHLPRSYDEARAAGL